MDENQDILAELGQASYVWHIAEDRLDWSENFKSLIGFHEEVNLESARGFEALLSAQSQQTRFTQLQESIAQDSHGDGGTYQCVYAVSAKVISGDEPVWVEDVGRWYPDENGKPSYARGIVRIVSERRKREESLKRKSEIDELTSLPNRVHLEEAIDLYIKNGLSLGKSAALLLISLSDFDEINSTLGFSAGDEVLKLVAEVLTSAKRDGDIAARFSGAKFGFIFDNCNEEEVESAARRLTSLLNGKVHLTSCGPVALKASAGACLLPKHAINPHEAIGSVTAALHQAQKRFGLKVSVYDPDPTLVEKRANDAKLLTQFAKAIEDGAMHLAFQPIVGAQTHRPEFHEALLRMTPETEGVIQDARFLGIAERLGLMRLLDRKALEMTLDVLEQCTDAVVSVNVTYDSIADGSWTSTLRERLLLVPDIAPRLIVEITESQIVSNMEETVAAIASMQEMGCRVAIDDFGAGYTSFSHLKDLNVDIIKIDGSFSREMVDNKKTRSFLEAMQWLSNRSSVETVIEWVEDADQAAQFKEWGYTYLQGELFGMPLPILPWERKRELSTKTFRSRSS
ncbi:MAG: bifunctional diguanylate cyclase/phosphodiesterase [Rhizobiaceae bacterium]|nr:bifunctional diguanylate cyclase/phosphodiesterase [Rhizobiaceae bacterium]